MKIDFPRTVWDKVMNLSRQQDISPIAIVFKAIDLLYITEGAESNADTTSQGGRPVTTMVK